MDWLIILIVILAAVIWYVARKDLEVMTEDKTEEGVVDQEIDEAIAREEDDEKDKS